MQPNSFRLSTALAAIIVIIVVTVSLAAADEVYVARATAVQLASIPSLPQNHVDTGELPPAGGEVAVATDRLAIGIDLLLAENVRSWIEGSDSSTDAMSRLESVRAFAGEPWEISASVIEAGAEASCNATRGTAIVENLWFAGQPIRVSGLANQKVVVPGAGALVINEHIEFSRAREITVHALHLIRENGEHMIIGIARAGIGCAVAVEPALWQDVKRTYGR